MRRPLFALCLLLAPCLAAGDLAAPATIPMLFRHLDTDDGLPQNTVMAILQDSQRFIWLATEDGLSRFDGYEVVRYGRERGDPESLAASFIWDVQEDRHGDLWVATKDAGVARWLRNSDRFQSYRNDPADPSTLSSDSTRHLLIDRAGRVWIGTVGSGLNVLDPRTGEIRRFRKDPERPDALVSDVITALHEDAQGQLWVGTAEGLHRLLPESGTFRRYLAAPGQPRSLSSNKISVVTSDRDGALWVGTFDGGLNRMDRGGNGFAAYRADPTRPGSLSHDEVRAVLADSAGRLWVGTADGLDLMDRDGRFMHYTRDPADPTSLGDNYVMSLYEDSAGLIWVGTRAGGVSRWNPRSWLFGHRRPHWLNQAYVMSFADDESGRLWIGTLGEGLHRFDPESGTHARLEDVTGGAALPDSRIMSLLTDTGGNLWIGTMAGGLGRLGPDSRLVTYRANPADPRALAVDGIMAMLEARDGRIWLGTFGGGVNIFDPASETVQRIAYDPRNVESISAPRATTIAQDREGFVWVGTEGGGLNLFTEQGALLGVFRRDASVPQSLSADTVYSVHVDASGRIWIGTDGGGLNQVMGTGLKPDDIRFRTVAKSDGLASDIVYGVRSDSSGALWLSSNAGLTRYEPDTGRTTLYHREHGLQSEEFNFGSHFRSRNGRLCFGGAGGFNVFDPLQLSGGAAPPRVVLTRVEVMNRPAETTVPYPVLPSLTLAHRDDVVSFEFAALDYTAPTKNRYAYRLVGFDRNWVEPGNRRRVSYTNLEPGDYVLEVRAANPDGAWSDVALELPVSVLPAPWQTSWARFLYALAAAVVVLAIWQAQRRRLRLAGLARERLERDVAERTAELRDRNEELARVSRAKSDFLSRMSHEIRTPMNGVIGMTELLGRTELSRRQVPLVAGIHGSARSLLQILNEILDLARVESGKLALETVEFDLRETMEEAVGTFAAQAESKGLELTVSAPVEPDCRVTGDPLRVRQVLQNLVGNALKFTTSGEISVVGSLDAAQDGQVTARIEVHDTGIGMSAETLARVFEPFSQADESTTRQFGGTGLGLAICRQLTALMGGTLEASSEPGIGSRFTLTLPMRRIAAPRPAPDPAPLEGIRVRLACRRVGLARAVTRHARAWGAEVDEADPAAAVPGEAKAGEYGTVWVVDADMHEALLDRLMPRRGGDQPPRLVALARIGTSVTRRLEERFGAESVVIKPLRQEALCRAIARAAGRTVAAGDEVAEAALDRKPLGRISGHVLVVEDNAVNAAVAEGMLTELGCTVALAEGGRKAVARAVGERFDLILMDLHMPDLDGLAVTALVRRAESGRRVPIVALTANAAETHRARCLAAGMDDFLGKPFFLEELYDVLSRWLPFAPAAERTVAESPGSAAVVAGLDSSAIARIRALDQPARPRLLPKVVAMYVGSSSQQIRELRDAAARGDLDSARALAHSLKSTSANVGAIEMARVAAALEKACLAGDAQRAERLTTELEDVHPQTLDALRHEALQDTA